MRKKKTEAAGNFTALDQIEAELDAGVSAGRLAQIPGILRTLLNTKPFI